MFENNKFYITTPIYYVNDIPHIGHAYTSLVCDVIARFMRLSGKKVKYISGTDEHGQKVERSAQKAGVMPQEFTDYMAERFRQLLKDINIEYDDFIRTTEVRHQLAVVKLWQKLQHNGNIYSGKYAGWYSVRDEAFYSVEELTDAGLAPTGASVEWVEEPSYFFALSKWQDKLLEFYAANPNFIYPKTRQNEVVSFVKRGLNDLSISRTSFKWGIPVPGDEKHIIYVWLDALTNYISALGYGEDNKREDAKKAGKDNRKPDSGITITAHEKQPWKNEFWSNSLHVVGKDILRFHAVYWPAFLMAANLKLPKTIIAHGWWVNEGQKISKSIGNVIDPVKLVKDFGVDPVRYFLIREVILGNDGNYVRQNLIDRNNNELANKVGNLCQRVCMFIYNNCNSEVPDISEYIVDEIYNSKLFTELAGRIKHNNTLIDSYNINNILDNIISIADQANIYIDREAPWKLLKSGDIIQMNKVLYSTLEIIRHLAIMLQPFIPSSAAGILDQLNIPKEQRQFAHLGKEYRVKSGTELVKPEPVFTKL